MATYRVIVNVGYVEVEVEAANSSAALTAATEPLAELAAGIVREGRYQVEQLAGAKASA